MATTTPTPTPTPPQMPTATPPVNLPKKGVARVKNVMSGDTVVLLGKAIQPNKPPPEVVFTMDRLSCPRMASKSNPMDEPGAFPAREWLRSLVVGKQISFETRKQGGAASTDRVYGWLFYTPPPSSGTTTTTTTTTTNGSNGGATTTTTTATNNNNGSSDQLTIEKNDESTPKPIHLNIECVRQGHATPKSIKFGTTPGGVDAAANAENGVDNTHSDQVVDPAVFEEQEYESNLLKAYRDAQDHSRGIHGTKILPLVRTIKNAMDDYATISLVEGCQKRATNKRLKCVIEHIFDGSRLRCHVTDTTLPEFQYANFTLLLAGVTCPRVGNPRAEPTPTQSEPFAEDAKQFVLVRLLQRELDITLIGTDKSGGAAVGTVHHPRGNIAIELLKVGFARMTDWSVRLMPPGEVPALRVAENNAKRTLQGIWHSYAPPVLSISDANLQGTVVEVVSGDTILVLPDGKAYDSEDVLQKLSLASIRAPRLGNERAGREDEPYSYECKERLRVLTIGKIVQVVIHYERDIPIRPNVNEKRAFATISVGAKYPDIAETLLKEGLVVTQRHRDDDEKSPRYDELLMAEAEAKSIKKNIHKEHTESSSSTKKGGGGGGNEYKKITINDLTEPRKAKAYSGSLMRAGQIKAIVDYVFNGGLFKLFVPKENCYIRFAPANVRCPQPSPSVGSKQQDKKSEPFGDDAKRHARLHLQQRPVEITCTGVTNSGVITGTMYVYGSGGQGHHQQQQQQKRDYTIELLGAGLATVDQRKIDYGEAPKYLIEAQDAAKRNKVGIWSIEQQQPKEDITKSKVFEKVKDTISTIRLSEIRSGNHFYFHIVNDESAKVMDDSMKLFTQNNGTAGAPIGDVKIGKIVAAIFDDRVTGKSWYRAKIIEKKGNSKVTVLFIDHGNIDVLPIASHLRPLDDVSLSIDRIPPVAKEATLAFTSTRPINTDEGTDAARLLQSTCWNKDLKARLLAPVDSTTTGNSKIAVIIYQPSSTTNDGTKDSNEDTINALLVYEGLARISKQSEMDILFDRMIDSTIVKAFATDMKAAEDAARRSRSGMWRYGDIGDDDDDEEER